MSRLLLLPTTFAKKFSPGDLSNRVLSLSRISSNLTADFLSSLLTFLFSAVMFIQFFIYEIHRFHACSYPYSTR
jgi:ABC-type bacteriocin/lantibiotic exporter with double-glycine peptidase domain